LFLLQIPIVGRFGPYKVYLFRLSVRPYERCDLGNYRARLLGFGKQIQSTKLGLGMQIGGNTGIRHAGSGAI